MGEVCAKMFLLRLLGSGSHIEQLYESNQKIIQVQESLKYRQNRFDTEFSTFSTVSSKNIVPARAWTRLRSVSHIISCGSESTTLACPLAAVFSGSAIIEQHNIQAIST